jgi:hypothetical protein
MVAVSHGLKWTVRSHIQTAAGKGRYFKYTTAENITSGKHISHYTCLEWTEGLLDSLEQNGVIFSDKSTSERTLKLRSRLYDIFQIICCIFYPC